MAVQIQLSWNSSFMSTAFLLAALGSLLVAGSCKARLSSEERAWKPAVIAESSEFEVNAKWKLIEVYEAKGQKRVLWGWKLEEVRRKGSNNPFDELFLGGACSCSVELVDGDGFLISEARGLSCAGGARQETSSFTADSLERVEAAVVSCG